MDKLDELAKTADDRLKQRLKEVVALLLLNGMELQDVRRHRHFYNVCKKEFAKAQELADQLAKEAAKAQRDPLDAVHLRLRNDKTSKWHQELFNLHGWGAAALLKLTESESPFLKMLAIDMILVSHGARLPKSVFDRLKKDKTPIVRFYGDYSERSTIARETASIIETHPQLTKKPSFSDWARSLLLLHRFRGVKSRMDGILNWPFITFDPKWSFDDYMRAAQQDMERVWDDR